jgi:hypothetical protein
VALNASIANEETTLDVNAKVLTAGVILGLLAGTVTAITSQTFSCHNATEQVYTQLEGKALTYTGDGLTVEGTIVPSRPGAVVENLSMVSPFDGWGSGRLGFAVRTVVSGVSADGLVNYSQQGDYAVSLPFEPGATEAICGSFAARLSAAVTPLVYNDCSAGVVSSAINRTLEAFSDGLPRGISLGATAQVRQSSPCVVGLEADVAQSGISGPMGPFTWKIGEAITLEP